MDSAWALTILYDHFNGFPINGGNLNQSPMSLITSNDIDILQPTIAAHDWQKINFRSRSKAFNKNIVVYDFSPELVLQELKQ